MMKTFSRILVAVAGLALMQPMASRADVDFAFFYDELSPYGDWVEVDDYGYCFQPYVDNGWRPYTDGYWADPDEGWLWVSNEPYGWATYHYGRWADIDGRGWVWVPGYDWGPGWVSWRESEEYIGWAPLPPQVAYRPQTGIRFGISFGFGDVGPGYYNFIRPRYFGYPGYRDYVLPYDRNVNIIEQTTNITNITNVVNNNRTVIYNNGPNRDFIRARSERPVRRLNIERDENLTAAQLRERKVRNQLNGDNYRVVAPKVNRDNRNAKPKKVAGKVSKDKINDGYAKISDKKKAEEIRKRIRSQADDPARQKDKVVAARAEDRDQGDRKNQGSNAGAGNGQAAKKDRQDNVAGGNNKKAGDAKRDEVLRKQADFEKKPKNADVKKREEREATAQQREMRKQADNNAGGNREERKNSGNKAGNGGSKADEKRDERPVNQANKPKPQKNDEPRGQGNRENIEKPRNNGQQQKPANDRPKASQEKKQQNNKPAAKPSQEKKDKKPSGQAAQRKDNSGGSKPAKSNADRQKAQPRQQSASSKKPEQRSGNGGGGQNAQQKEKKKDKKS